MSPTKVNGTSLQEKMFASIDQLFLTDCPETMYMMAKGGGSQRWGRKRTIIKLQAQFVGIQQEFSGQPEVSVGEKLKLVS